MRAQEPMSSTASRPPTLNGRYVVTRLVGKGAQARVYLAYDTRLRQWRAVKVLAPQFLDDTHIRSRFDQEAQAMARLSHANLLRVVDVDQEGDAPFMVMELARGGSIVDWMKRNGKVPPRLSVRIAQQCCDGLSHAHSLGVVHRDIKPHNLLLKDDGTVVITDFGIAHMEDVEGLTQTGSVMGTFVFMAPEQRTDAKTVDARADVYSLGATLYTMLTTKTSAELFLAESRDSFLEPVPEPLRQVILTACRYDRDERYASMAALRQALETQLEALPPDPAAPALPDVLIPIPERVPDTLEPGSGVDDLFKVLAAAEPDTDPMGTAALDALMSRHPTTAYSEPGGSYEDASTVLPYQMPKIDQERLERVRRVRSTVSDLSEEDEVPEYVDQSTLDQRPEPSQVEITAEIDAAPSNPSLVKPPTPVQQPPREAAPSPPAAAEPAAEPEDRSSLRIWVLSVAIVIVALVVVTAVLAKGVTDKYEASVTVATAASTMVKAVAQQDSLLADLTHAGADEKLLREKWFAFKDAKSATVRTEAAAAFVETAVTEAERVGAPNLIVTQAAFLQRTRAEWLAARARLEAVRNSNLGRITGDLGVTDR